MIIDSNFGDELDMYSIHYCLGRLDSNSQKKKVDLNILVIIPIFLTQIKINKFMICYCCREIQSQYKCFL